MVVANFAYVYVLETNVLQRSFVELLPSEKATVMEELYDKVCGTMKRAEILRKLEALSGKPNCNLSQTESLAKRIPK